MDGEEKPVDQTQSSRSDSERAEKHLTLRDATHKLKAEALRRYRLRHADDPEYETEEERGQNSRKNTEDMNTTKTVLDIALSKTSEPISSDNQISKEENNEIKQNVTLQLKKDPSFIVSETEAQTKSRIDDETNLKDLSPENIDSNISSLSSESVTTSKNLPVIKYKWVHQGGQRKVDESDEDSEGKEIADAQSEMKDIESCAGSTKALLSSIAQLNTYGEAEEVGQGDNVPKPDESSSQQKVEEPVEPPITEKKDEEKPVEDSEQGQEKKESEDKPADNQDKKDEEGKEEKTDEIKPESNEKPVEQVADGDKAPEQTQEADKAPEQAQEADKAPEQAQEADKAPEQAQEADKAPEQAQEADKAPEQAQEADKAPEQAQEADKASEQAQEADKAPEQAQEADKAPEQAQEADKAPEQTQEADKAAEQAQEADKAPEQVQQSETASEQNQQSENAPEQAKEGQDVSQTQEGQEPEKKPEGQEVQSDTNQNATENKDEGEEKKDEEKETDEQKPDSETADTNQSATEKEDKNEEEEGIPSTFFYEIDTLTSRARVTENSGLPEDLLTLSHSFGYDCTKRNNLHLLDEKTVVFAAGNMVLLLDLQSREQTYIRSTSGGGIGAITVHPSRKYFAVAEKGHGPNINIFEYPSLKLYRILRGGTERSYSYVDFDPKGELLASMGGDPDYMLTVWNWKQEQTVLRSKAFSQEVFRVTFSTELEGQLTTAGTGHIRFWKMADTFTGLKLQGELGKFGKTEISDIEGYVELPDGKVLSGTEGGNMLLWDGGLIKVEIGKKGKKPCHQGAIQQILLDEGELMTVGTDGFIRVWDFESVDTADVADESGLFEMEPMNELRVGNDVHLRSIVKSVDTENEPTIWYAQDANGGIWKLDLSFSHTSQAPEKMFTYHAGPITGCGASPISHLVATTGQDHTVRVFDVVQKKQLYEKKYTDGGTALLWAPQIVDPKAQTVLVGFNDGVVRVMTISKASDDQVHRKHKHDIDMDLKQVFKPHNKAVTSMAINDKGDILATGGEDNTIFFMTIGETYEPIGYLETPTAVRKLQWSPSKFDKSTLLVFCDEGNVLEIGSPDETTFDTSKTYHITGLPQRSFKFKSIKSRLRHEEDLERKRLEEIERKKREAEERRRRIERGLETESEQGDEEEETKEPEPEWKPYIPAEPSPILTGFYSNEDSFWLSMGGFDAGYLYECKFVSEEEREKLPDEVKDEPLQSVPVVDSNDIPITFIKYSTNGRQVYLGMEDGSIRIQNLETENEISSIGPYWNMNYHDNNYGHIESLQTSYDDRMMVSVGKDGNFFLYGIMDQEKIDQKVAEAKAKLPSAKKSEEDISVDDIMDPNAYSIEDAKQKAEHDKMMKIADEKKREVRRQIAKLRRQFKNILEQNEGLPPHLQLKKEEFELDREIKLELDKQKADRIDIVRKELAWEAEKQRIALEKLRKRYKDVVECERIVVKAFQTPHEVASFRAAKLSDDFYQMKADYERRRTMTNLRDDITRDPTRDLLAGQQRVSDEQGGTGGKSGDQGSGKVTTTLKGSMGERINKALQKVEEKKKKRAARRAQWEELYDTKPDDDYEDPADVSAIKEAKDNMGDYKLKTAKDYVVPDHLRMNVEKARGRLLVLKDLIHDHKYNFNLRLISIRDKKIKVIEEIRDLVCQLEDVQSILSPDKHKPIPAIPVMHPDEMPEKKLEYTRDTLLAFKREMEIREKEAKHGGGGGFGGFGGFGGAEAPKEKAGSPVPKGGSVHASLATKTEEGEDVTDLLSPLEIELKEAEEIRILFDQDHLLNRIQELLSNFDAELRLLRHDKFKLDITMKNADLRQVTLFEEFVLLKEYEKREDVLASKVTGKQQEKLDMQAKIIDVQSKVEGKKKEIEKYQEKEKALYTQFQSSLGDNNKFAEYLMKVFKKKIKRAKKKTTEGEGSDEDSDEDSDDESDWDEDDEESDEEGAYDLDVCPPLCDQNLYDNTCQLREKRLDIEEVLQEEKKNNDALKKESESLNKKLKVVEGALKSAQNDLEAFQLEKQQKLNDLDVVVTLKLHQIQYMINGQLPQDLAQTLVFESNGVTRLQQRIKELEHEKSSQKKFMKESRRKHVQLIKDRKVFDSKISEMDEICNEMMVAKFGRLVDLEKLETITVNRGIEELKEKLRLTEIQCSEEVTEWDEKIAAKKAKITGLIRDNTNRLDQLCILLNEKKSYEGTLDSRQKNSGEEYTGARKADMREKQRLIQLVQLQAQEIDALKEEIMLLSRKGGHILPPAQPPLPQSPPNMRTMSN